MQINDEVQYKDNLRLVCKDNEWIAKIKSINGNTLLVQKANGEFIRVLKKNVEKK